MGEGLEQVERKFNPYHDELGRFTYAQGGGKADLGIRPRTSLDPIKGYPEEGKNAWRKANDQIFIKAAADPRYMDPQLMKAWAMEESGGNRNAFLSDTFQVNKLGDWADEKTNVGLQKGQIMTTSTSADAALKWLDMKGHITTKLADGSYSTAYTNLHTAFERYNKNKATEGNGKPHYVNYANKIFENYAGGW